MFTDEKDAQVLIPQAVGLNPTLEKMPEVTPSGRASNNHTGFIPPTASCRPHTSLSN